MYQKLREEFPVIAGKIQPLAKMIKEKYPVVISISHPLSSEIWFALRKNTKTTNWLNSETPVTGNIINRWGRSHTSEAARLLYLRLKEKKCEFRMESDRINIYVKDLNQAQEWIAWTLNLQKTSKNSMIQIDHCLHYVKAIHEGMEVGQVARKLERFRDFKYLLKFKDHYFSDTVERDKFINVLKNLRSEIQVNNTLHRMMGIPDGKRGPGWGNNYTYGMWNAHLYTKDEGPLTFLQLSYPHLIQKIYRVQYTGK